MVVYIVPIMNILGRSLTVCRLEIDLGGEVHFDVDSWPEVDFRFIHVDHRLGFTLAWWHPLSCVLLHF